MFAKLFGPPEKQILVLLHSNEDGPAITFYIQPEGMGVSHFSLGYDDDPQGEETAKAYFEKIDEAKARSMVNDVLVSMLANDAEKYKY